MWKPKYWIILFAGIALAVGCQPGGVEPDGSGGVTNLPSPTRLAMETPVLTQTPVQTAVPTAFVMMPTLNAATPTTKAAATDTAVTQIPYSFYPTLPDGQYLVVADYQTAFGDFSIGHETSLKAVSLENAETWQLTWGGNSLNSALTVDGTKLAYLADYYASSPIKGRLKVLDLATNVVQEVPVAAGCGGPSWSPDGTKLALRCEDDGQSAIVVVTLSTGEQTKIGVANADLWFPSWSPDEQWLAYSNGPHGMSGPDGICGQPEDGVYFIDTKCLDHPDTCQPQVALVGNEHLCYYPPLWWSSSSQILALNVSQVPNLGWLTFIGIGQKSYYRQLDEHATNFSWSPDGRHFAVNFFHSYSRSKYSTNNNDIYIGSIDTSDDPVLLKADLGIVIGWIYKLTFRTGDILSITPAGHDLNLREAPSIHAAVLRKLQPGDTVTILEGPVEADGYTWWRMRTADGLEGWAVEVAAWYQK